MEASSSLKLGTLKKSPQHLEAADRVKEWTRERFSLPEDAAILVTRSNRVQCPAKRWIP